MLRVPSLVKSEGVWDEFKNSIILSCNSKCNPDMKWDLLVSYGPDKICSTPSTLNLWPWKSKAFSRVRRILKALSSSGHIYFPGFCFVRDSSLYRVNLDTRISTSLNSLKATNNMFQNHLHLCQTLMNFWREDEGVIWVPATQRTASGTALTTILKRSFEDPTAEEFQWSFPSLSLTSLLLFLLLSSSLHSFFSVTLRSNNILPWPYNPGSPFWSVSAQIFHLSLTGLLISNGLIDLFSNNDTFLLRRILAVVVQLIIPSISTSSFSYELWIVFFLFLFWALLLSLWLTKIGILN